MAISNLRELEIGTSISYGGYRHLTFVGTDEKHGILQDRNGDQRKFYIWLIEKYGTVNPTIENIDLYDLV
jgi:predicted RNA-binding protein associated with RNAse of E/G family